MSAVGSTSYIRERALDVKDGVLHLRNEEDQTVVYIAVEKIAAMYECKDHPPRPGFIV